MPTASAYADDINTFNPGATGFENPTNLLDVPDLAYMTLTGFTATKNPSETIAVTFQNTLNDPAQVNIPANATITGIAVTLMDVSTSEVPASGTTYEAFLWDGSAQVGTAKTGSLPASGNLALGGATDLWGATITPASIMSQAWGFTLTVSTASNGANIAIDAAQFTVTYTVPGGEATSMRQRLPGRRNRSCDK